MKVVPVKCKTHPKYQAKRQPRSFCEPCWRIWIDKQDHTPERQMSDAGDRRDWDECERLEAKAKRRVLRLPPLPGTRALRLPTL